MILTDHAAVDYELVLEHARPGLRHADAGRGIKRGRATVVRL